MYFSENICQVDAFDDDPLSKISTKASCAISVFEVEVASADSALKCLHQYHLCLFILKR